MECSLLGCPLEILGQVFELLSPADLFAVSLVCRDLRQLAEPSLYHRVHWKWISIWARGTPRPRGKTRRKPRRKSSFPPIVPFLRTISKRPVLATFVQILNLEGGATPPLPAFALNQTILDKAIGNIDISEDDRRLWILDLNGGDMNAFVALLLLQLPNLQDVWLHEYFLKGGGHVGMILRSSLCKPLDHRPFQRLKQVHCHLADNVSYLSSRNAAEVLPLFYIPSVEHISALIDDRATSFEWPSVHPPKPSSLTSLDITRLHEGHLGRLLSVTQGLRELRWTWFFESNAIDLDQVDADLSHVKETLTNLSITAMLDEDIYGYTGTSGDIVEGSLKTLANYPALKILQIPLPFLTGSIWPSHSQPLAQSLPRSLEVLTITDDLYLQNEYGWLGESPLHAIQAWLENWKEYTPSIRMFHLLLREIDYDDWGPEMRQELRDTCSRVGVDVMITKVRGEM